jgi:phage shock protein PspC (stress-responsive transcriptional regulator)
MADHPPVPPTSPAPPPPVEMPPPRRHLTRSGTNRMWAGVAGGMAEYFDLDPSLVRLLWVAATIVTQGIAVAVYIILWILLPRGTQEGSASAWHDWSEEFHSETQRLAEEARRVADDVRGHGWRAPEGGAASGKGAPESTTAAVEEPWWRSERYVEPHRGHHRHSKSTGVILVALGVLLLAANAGVFRWIDSRTMWPLILIGLGVILLGRQSGWWSR